jgi:predicted HicB family RNase H-like nuclease
MKEFKDMTQAELEAFQQALSDELNARANASEESKRDASRRISEKLRLVDQLYKECEAAARDAGISFSYTNPDGSGGYFDPNDSYSGNNGWSNSSMNC